MERVRNKIKNDLKENKEMPKFIRRVCGIDMTPKEEDYFCSFFSKQLDKFKNLPLEEGIIELAKEVDKLILKNITSPNENNEQVICYIGEEMWEIIYTLGNVDDEELEEKCGGKIKDFESVVNKIFK